MLRWLSQDDARGAAPVAHATVEEAGKVRDQPHVVGAIKCTTIYSDGGVVRGAAIHDGAVRFGDGHQVCRRISRQAARRGGRLLLRLSPANGVRSCLQPWCAVLGVPPPLVAAACGAARCLPKSSALPTEALDASPNARVPAHARQGAGVLPRWCTGRPTAERAASCARVATRWSCTGPLARPARFPTPIGPRCSDRRIADSLFAGRVAIS